MPTSSQNVFALLVAIDEYQVKPLDGCVNDSLAVADFLRTTIKSDQLHLETLHNKKATRDNILAGFMTHLAQAKAGDVVFIHYSGHGSRETADPVFWEQTPNFMNEVVVTYDSLLRDTNGEAYLKNPLADKELRWMLNRLSANNPHIVFVMDCCHSGNGVREVLNNQVKSRFTPTAARPARTINDFVFAQAQYGGQLSAVLNSNNKFEVPLGRYVQLAACQDNQTAKELYVGGQPRGIFTYSLLDILQTTRGNITYSDLLKRASSRVVNRVSDQVPQLDAPVAGDESDFFLLGAARRNSRYYIVTRDANGQWIIDAGSVHGISLLPDSGDTLLAVYDSTTDIDQKPLDFGLTAKVNNVYPDHSDIEFLNNDFPNEESCQARVLQMPIPKTPVRLLAEKPNVKAQQEAVVQLRKAIETANQGQASLYLREVGECDDSDYWVYAYEHNGIPKYRIIRSDADRPLIKQTEGFTEIAAQTIVSQLEHISRYDRILRLQNQETNFIGPQKVSLELYRKVADGSEELVTTKKGEARFEYSLDATGKVVAPKCRIRLVNNSNREVWCSVLMLDHDFTVSNSLLPTLRLGPKESVFLFEGKSITPDFDLKKVPVGINEMRTTFKLIASTTQFDSSLLNMRGLEMAKTDREITSKSIEEIAQGQRKVKNALESLFMRTNKRGWVVEEPVIMNDWSTDEINVYVQRPITTEEVQLERSGIKIKPHTGLKATYRLGALAQQKKRDIATADMGTSGGLGLPDILLNHPNIMYPMPFVTGRSTSAELNILQIDVSDNEKAVTPDNPLEVELPFVLGKNEAIIPLALDNDGLVYPVGFAKTKRVRKVAERGLSTTESVGRVTTVYIQHLPVQKERGLFNTAKIVFQKFVADKVGISYTYPHLAAVVKDSKKGCKYLHINKANELTALVEKAQNIVLVTHGFTGETQYFFKPDPKGTQTPFLDVLAAKYDLVLAFDYDSYSTSIPQNAADLKKRLASIGLDGSNGSKKITLVAHSMGGLVSRHFVEKLGGNAVVSHLVTVGSPHNGTPWPRVLDWAKTCFSLVLSHFTPVGWPLAAISFLADKLQLLKGLDKVSEAMQLNSTYLEELNSSPDPNVRYTLLAGNVELIEARRGLLPRLLAKLGLPEDSHNKVVGLLFGEENDLVVGQSSMTGVANSRTPAPVTQPIACDHVTYFANPESLKILNEVL